jgi:hypothetical protein
MNLFGFRIIPLNTLLCIPIYIGTYSLIDLLMNITRSGLCISFIVNVLGHQMTIFWEIGDIIKNRRR